MKNLAIVALAAVATLAAPLTPAVAAGRDHAPGFQCRGIGHERVVQCHQLIKAGATWQPYNPNCDFLIAPGFGPLIRCHPDS